MTPGQELALAMIILILGLRWLLPQKDGSTKLGAILSAALGSPNAGLTTTGSTAANGIVSSASGPLNKPDFGPGS